MKQKVQIVVIEKNNNTLNLLQFQVAACRGGFWQNVTGSVELNENLPTAAQRELYEETYLSYGPLIDLNLSFHFEDQYGHEVYEHCYLAFLENPRLIKLSTEHQNYRFLNIENVTSNHFCHISNYEAFLKAKQKANYLI